MDEMDEVCSCRGRRHAPHQIMVQSLFCQMMKKIQSLTEPSAVHPVLATAVELPCLPCSHFCSLLWKCHKVFLSLCSLVFKSIFPFQSSCLFENSWTSVVSQLSCQRVLMHQQPKDNLVEYHGATAIVLFHVVRKRFLKTETTGNSELVSCVENRTPSNAVICNFSDRLKRSLA